MYLRQISVGPMQNFSYLVGENGGKVSYIDPGWDTEKVISIAKEDGVEISAILLTHTHYDHCQEALKAMKLTKADLFLSENSVAEFTEVKDRVRGVTDGSEISIGDLKISVIATPGHKEDALCYYLPPALFTGDTLFIGGVGRTDLPGSDPQILPQSLQKLAKLPSETIIYPGHDYGEVPSRTLKEEIKLNPDLNN